MLYNHKKSTNNLPLNKTFFQKYRKNITIEIEETGSTSSVVTTIKEEKTKQNNIECVSKTHSSNKIRGKAFAIFSTKECRRRFA
jgi:hypothetical protein